MIKIKHQYLMPLLTLKSNGGGNVAMELARSIAKMGGGVTVITSSYYDTSAVKLPENSDLRFLVVQSIGGKILSTALLLVHGFLFSLKYKPNLIYTHIATSLIINFSNHKSIWLAQDIEYRFYNGGIKSIFKIILRRLVNDADLLVTSYWLAKYFRRIGAKIIYQNDIGVSKKLFNNLLYSEIALRENDILIVAKHGNHKRGEESKYLAKYFSDNGFRVILINQMNSAQPLIDGNLQTLGAVTQGQMLNLLLNSKIYVNLSRSEGFGLVPLEALSAGCMVVSTFTPSVAKNENKRLRILLNNSSLMDSAIQAVNQFMNNPIDISANENAANNFFLEDWTYNASRCLAIYSSN